jgi:stage II sporulation protein D
MLRPLKQRLPALLLLCALTLSSLPVAARQERTRPRRVNPEAAPPVSPTPAREPAAETHPLEAGLKPLDGVEPSVRVGLSTDARTATVSTAGRLLRVETTGAETSVIEAASARVEPRSYPPVLPVSGEGLYPATTATASAPTAARPNGGGQMRPTGGRTQEAGGARDGGSSPRQSPASRNTTAAQTVRPKGNIRLTSRLSAPARGAAIFAHGETAPRLDARGPVIFSSTDEERDPVRFNDKPYRGRLEVFPNARGTLTVVNVVPLEEYLRGVVPNELSPGGWPELEALKAQAVAARTYAVSNSGRFAAEGFDLLPTTRSQVYGGRATEHPLSDRAVSETRGLVATYAGRPINALYTSTCGGRTENAEEIFGGERVPYLRARECAAESAHPFGPDALRTSRETPQVKAAGHEQSARDAALLATHGVLPAARLSDEWLDAALTADEARRLLAAVAALAKQAPPAAVETTRPAAFASALVLALDGESRGAALLNRADVEYLLSFRDAGDVPAEHRADVALLLRDGVLELYPDATLRPRQPLARARAHGLVARALGARGLFRLQKAVAKPAAGGSLSLRPAGGRGAARTLKLAPDAHLFRSFGARAYPAREVRLVGGEPVVFHTNAAGEADYLEVFPAPDGAATDRFSKYANWSETMTPAALLSRLGRAAAGVGTPVDVRVRRRGASGRVLDLEVIGTAGAARLTGGRIRTALALREQLFVVEREHDDEGRVVRFTFAGRGWGHGVGMCQVGAYGLARAGYGHERILKAYYTGVGLTRLY